MSCIYISGRAPAGATVALETQALRSPVLASSCSALCKLALSLGGERALRLLVSDSFVSLLRGYGQPGHRLRLARSYLERLRIPSTSLLSDAGGTSGPCRFLVFSMERLSLKIYSEDAEAEPIRLVDLVAALCSLTPVPLSISLDALMDAEVIYPSQAISDMIGPKALLAISPAEQDTWLEGLPVPSAHLQCLTLNDRILCRRPSGVPTFRIPCVSRGFFDQLTTVPVARRHVQAELGAAVLCFLLSCHLLALKSSERPAASPPHAATV